MSTPETPKETIQESKKDALELRTDLENLENANIEDLYRYYRTKESEISEWENKLTWINFSGEVSPESYEMERDRAISYLDTRKKEFAAAKKELEKRCMKESTLNNVGNRFKKTFDTITEDSQGRKDNAETKTESGEKRTIISRVTSRSLSRDNKGFYYIDGEKLDANVDSLMKVCDWLYTFYKNLRVMR